MDIALIMAWSSYTRPKPIESKYSRTPPTQVTYTRVSNQTNPFVQFLQNYYIVADLVNHSIFKRAQSKAQLDASLLGRRITKHNFLAFMEEPFKAAFSESNILAAYAKAGIWPFNPGAIPTAIHELSKPSAIDGEFPAGPCSPIKAIVSSYQQELHTMLPQGPGNQEPTTTPRASPLTDHQNVQNEQEATSGHILQCLVKESSISFIASAKPITPHKTLPHIPIAKPPKKPLISTPGPHTLHSKANRTAQSLAVENESLQQELQQAKQHIAALEAHVTNANAHIIVQTIHNKQLHGALYEKTESSKTKGKKALFVKGQGVLVMSEEFKELRMESQKAKDATEEKKNENAAKKVARDAEKAAAVADKQVKLDKYVVDVAAWEARCAKLLSKGAKKGKLPKKPPHPTHCRQKARASIAPTVSEEDIEDFRGDLSSIKMDTEGEESDGEDGV
jgi:hypothetical protein